jgi:hypothetical protein
VDVRDLRLRDRNTVSRLEVMINWRRVAVIGLTWLFIANAGACDRLFPPRCEPRRLSTCEP